MSKDTSSKVVKASMNNETATSTERHNDREMYEKKESRYDVSKTFIGIATVASLLSKLKSSSTMQIFLQFSKLKTIDT